MDEARLNTIQQLKVGCNYVHYLNLNSHYRLFPFTGFFGWGRSDSNSAEIFRWGSFYL